MGDYTEEPPPEPIFEKWKAERARLRYLIGVANALGAKDDAAHLKSELDKLEGK